MKFAQMMDQSVEPGGLVEWSPVTRGGFTGWADDDRQTSHNHELHLRSALDHRRSTGLEGGRESWLGLVIEFDEPLSIPAIRAALTGWIDRHEVLRSHVVIDDDGLRRVTTGAGTVGLKMGRIGWYTEAGPLLDQLAGSFDRATAPLQWPAYLFATVARERSFTLLFAGDHSLVDGYSLIVAQYELRELYRCARARRAPELPPVGSYVDFSALERRAADSADRDHPSARAWSTYLADHGGDLPRFDLSGDDEARPHHVSQAGSDPAVDGSPDHGSNSQGLHGQAVPGQGPPQSSVTLDLLDDAAANRFTAVCSAAGGGVFAGVLAALAVAYRDCGGGPLFRCVTPRHTRNEGRWSGALGWFVSTTPVCVDVSGTHAVDQQIARATEALRRARVAADLPFLRVAELLDYSGDPTFVVSFIDTRHAPGAAEADGGRARVVRSHSYAGDEVFIWVNRTPSGVRISARFPATGRAHGDVSRFLLAFAEVVRHIGDASTFAGQGH